MSFSILNFSGQQIPKYQNEFSLVIKAKKDEGEGQYVKSLLLVSLHSTMGEEKAFKNNNFGEDQNKIFIQLKASHKLSFVIGLFLGFFVLRHQFILDSSTWLMTNIRGEIFKHE